MGVVDEQTSNRRAFGMRKYANILLGMFASGLPFIGLLFGLAIHQKYIQSVYLKSSNRAKDMVLAFLLSAPLFIVHLTAITGKGPFFSLMSHLSGEHLIISIFVISSMSTAALMFFAYHNHFVDD